MPRDGARQRSKSTNPVDDGQVPDGARAPRLLRIFVRQKRIFVRQTTRRQSHPTRGDVRTGVRDARRPVRPAPILVDVRAPLVVANGCPFPVAMSGFDLMSVTRGVTRGGRPAGADVVSVSSHFVSAANSNSNSRLSNGFVVVAPGRQTMIPTDPRIGGGNREGKSNDAKNAGEEDLRRTVHVARAGHGRAPTRVEVDPRRGIARAAVATAEGSVDVALSAAVWSPRVTAASATPCTRVTVVPAMSAVNLANVVVAVEASGSGTPRDLAPGAGPRACLIEAGNLRRPTGFHRRGLGDGGDAGDGIVDAGRRTTASSTRTTRTMTTMTTHGTWTSG